MVFSSLLFLFFFLALTLILYFAFPQRIKDWALLIASIFFYAWGEPVYVVLMLFSVGFNYVTGLELDSETDPTRKRWALISSIVVNLLLLGFFKYCGFLVETINGITPLNLPVPELALPIGISFYTFQALSYIIDVYLGKVSAQKSLLKFGVYLSLFPQLVAGPIVKYSDIAEQLEHRKISLLKCGQGAERLILGLAKKVILANNLGLLYSTIQDAPERTVLTAWLGVAAYTLQIYFDFSGYSDMAIGLGRMLGFQFPENFNYPYLADSITEFWRRWHISLSSWFRDYVYIPLGGNRVSTWKHIRNLLIVWMLTGLWHGANWNFVVWGLYYGILLIVEKYFLSSRLERLPGWLRHGYTLLLVGVGWVIFSNTDFSLMLGYLGNLIGIGASGFASGATWYYLRNNLVLFLIALPCCTPVVRDWLHQRSRRTPALAVGISVVLFLVSTAYLVYGSYNPFLYFRF